MSARTHRYSLPSKPKKCDHCGSLFNKKSQQARTRYDRQRYCSRQCRGASLNPRRDTDSRYRRITTPDGRRIYEHRWVMEQHLERRLNSWEQVHHRDKNRLDNRVENLEVLTSSEHGLRHTWRPIESKCTVCSSVFKPRTGRRGIQKTCSRSCAHRQMWRTRRGQPV